MFPHKEGRQIYVVIGFEAFNSMLQTVSVIIHMDDI